MTAETPAQAPGAPAAVFARWCRVDTGPGTEDDVIAERWRLAYTEDREFWRSLDAVTAVPAKIGELTIAVCEIDGHAPHAARVTVDYGLQVTSFCLPPEHAEFLGDALASGKAAAVTAELHRLRELLAEALDYAERIPDAQGETMLGRAIRERIAGIRKRAGLPS